MSLITIILLGVAVFTLLVLADVHREVREIRDALTRMHDEVDSIVTDVRGGLYNEDEE